MMDGVADAFHSDSLAFVQLVQGQGNLEAGNLSDLSLGLAMALAALGQDLAFVARDVEFLRNACHVLVKFVAITKGVQSFSV